MNFNKKLDWTLSKDEYTFKWVAETDFGTYFIYAKNGRLYFGLKKDDRQVIGVRSCIHMTGVKNILQSDYEKRQKDTQLENFGIYNK